MLTVSVLGPVEVRRDGVLLEVPSGKTTEVLTRLAMDAGHRVGTDALIEDVWADAVGTGKNTLQSKVSQLRKALGDARLVIGGPDGYCLDLAPDCVDAVSAVRLAELASGRRTANDAAGSLEAATQGLELFRDSGGEVLVGAGDGEWLAPHRTRLEEVRLGLLEDRLAAQVELGLGGAVVGELESLVAQHPLREGLWSSLITALYRLHRQADALAAYARVRRILADELGVDPNPGLVALEAHILRQDLEAGTASRGEEVPGPIGNLPSLYSQLVGRTAELADLHALIGRGRLVTLVGPAGVGKTRLALELGRGVRRPGGVWLVRLDSVERLDQRTGSHAPSSVAQAVAEALHVAGGAPRLAERFAGTEAVLLLDNCEHLVDSVADLVSELLDAAPDLRIVATSQVPLGLDGERVYALEPLGLDDSVALFGTRAADVRKAFAIDEDTIATVEAVCRRLDGLPLAIELAAARVRSLSLGDIARRLDDRFALLQDPTTRRPSRRRALSAAIGWSYDLLFPDDQRGLWALSVFSGRASVAAAEAVMTALGVPGESAMDVIGRLVDRSLVIVEAGPEDPGDVGDAGVPRGGGALRYRLLDSIRAFARAHLADAGLVEVAEAAHAAWFAGLAQRCEQWVRRDRQPACVAVVRADRADIDGALSWAADHDPVLGLRIANGFGWTWVVLGDGVSGAARLRGALRSADDLAADLVSDQERATALSVAGWLEASAGNLERADDDLGAALTIAENLGDPRLIADTRRHLAFLRIQQGRPADVLALCAASLAFTREAESPWETAGCDLLSAFGSIMVGDTAAAAAAAQEAVTLLIPLADSWGLTHADAMLGSIASAEGRSADAAEWFGRAVMRSELLGFRGQRALHLSNLGLARQGMGDVAGARETFDAAIAAGVACGDLRIASTSRIHLARLLAGLGENVEALALARAADEWYQSAGGGDGAQAARALVLSLGPDLERRP